MRAILSFSVSGFVMCLIRGIRIGKHNVAKNYILRISDGHDVGRAVPNRRYGNLVDKVILCDKTREVCFVSDTPGLFADNGVALL